MPWGVRLNVWSHGPGGSGRGNNEVTGSEPVFEHRLV